MRGLALACVGVAGLVSVTFDTSFAQSAVFVGQGRYQQQATKSCPAGQECTLSFKKIPAGKQVVTGGVSCEEVTGFLPFLEISSGGKLLFRVAVGSQGATRVLALVLDPSHAIAVKAAVSGSVPRTLSCLITGTIANAS